MEFVNFFPTNFEVPSLREITFARERFINRIKVNLFSLILLFVIATKWKLHSLLDSFTFDRLNARYNYYSTLCNLITFKYSSYNRTIDRPRSNFTIQFPIIENNNFTRKTLYIELYSKGIISCLFFLSAIFTCNILF